MKAIKRFTAGILCDTASVVSRLKLFKILPRAILLNTWKGLCQTRLLGDITFNFNIKFCGISFQLQGPFRYLAGDYYLAYITQGGYEPTATAHITQVARQHPAPRILDVGAHYGWYTIYLAKVIAGRGTVFAVEPSETIFSTLQRNLELNEVHNVRLYKLPLSDSRETICMVPSKSYPGEPRYMQSVTERVVVDGYAAVNAIPFDELNEIEQIRPNIVKIDVRGVWRKVIDGMRESLCRDVEHLYLEMDTLSEDLSSHYEDVRHVILMLRDMGMDIYEIQPFKRNGRMQTADENRIAQTGKNITMLYGVKRRG